MPLTSSDCGWTSLGVASWLPPMAPRLAPRNITSAANILQRESPGRWETMVFPDEASAGAGSFCLSCPLKPESRRWQSGTGRG